MRKNKVLLLGRRFLSEKTNNNALKNKICLSIAFWINCIPFIDPAYFLNFFMFMIFMVKNYWFKIATIQTKSTTFVDYRKFFCHIKALLCRCAGES